MKRLFIIAAIALIAMGLSAQTPARVPAYRGLIERVQPSGDTIRTYLRGDEHKHWMIMEDGWQILETKRGWYKYAKLNCKGVVVASRRKAHNADKRAKWEIRWLNKYGIKKD